MSFNIADSTTDPDVRRRLLAAAERIEASLEELIRKARMKDLEGVFEQLDEIIAQVNQTDLKKFTVLGPN